MSKSKGKQKGSKREDNERKGTIRMLDDETGAVLSSDEVDISVIAQIHTLAEEWGITEEEAFQRIMGKALTFLEKQIKDVEDRVNEFDPLLADRVRKMMFETLKEMREPGWKYPEGMEIQGNPPPEAIAEAIVRMRLHMSEHEN